jgi:hypothetical protein
MGKVADMTAVKQWLTEWNESDVTLLSPLTSSPPCSLVRPIQSAARRSLREHYACLSGRHVVGILRGGRMRSGDRKHTVVLSDGGREIVTGDECTCGHTRTDMGTVLLRLEESTRGVV